MDTPFTREDFMRLPPDEQFRRRKELVDIAEWERSVTLNNRYRQLTNSWYANKRTLNENKALYDSPARNRYTAQLVKEIRYIEKELHIKHSIL